MRYGIMILILICSVAEAQLWDDFSDEDLTNGPVWVGQPDKFRFSSSSAIPPAMRPALQLDNEGADTAFLSLFQQHPGATQWEMWVKLSFNTSSSNFARVYLAASDADPNISGEGVFIQFGGANDSVWFGKMDTAGVHWHHTLPSLYTGNSTNTLRLKVVTDGSGNWNFWGDPQGGHALVPLGGCLLEEEMAGDYLILGCIHTSSNATKFYFDDIYFGPRILDSIPPVIVSGKIITPNEIFLSFDEAVDEASAAEISNYSVSGGIGKPYQAFRMLDPENVMLFFDLDLVEGINYRLQVENIQDLFGNIMVPDSVEISYYNAEPYDVLIHEIMADPSPQLGLPGYEYIELFNRTDFTIDLTGWELLISGKEYTFPEVGIGPKAYLILTPDDGAWLFSGFGFVQGFSSFSISNEGAAISLQDSSGTVICHTEYSPGKFSDHDKSEGGWSLELTDPRSPCLDEIAWEGSKDSSGGTPGRENSWNENLEIPLQIETVCCLDDRTVLLRFDRIMDSPSILDITLYSASDNIGYPVLSEVPEGQFREVMLTFENPFNDGVIYRLEVSAAILDCQGIEAMNSIMAEFSLPSKCDPADIIFNEILFHPLSNGAEYIELYNRSERTIHINELVLAYIREVPPNLPDTELYDLSISCKPMMPGDYLVLTRYPGKIESGYFPVFPERLWKTEPFPLLNNDEGKLLLLDADRTLIDSLFYSEEMHSPLLNSFTGVALERVFPSGQAIGAENWKSASSASGYGTPGYRNSQYMDPLLTENALETSPRVFTPNGDGKDDLLAISCRFQEPGMLISIFIFSEQGRIARRLVNNSLAGTENHFTWDGVTDGDFPAPDGVYVVLLECVSMNGYSRRYKKAVALYNGN